MQPEELFARRFSALPDSLRFALVSSFSTLDRAVAQQVRVLGLPETVGVAIEGKILTLADDLAGELVGVPNPSEVLTVMSDPSPPADADQPGSVEPPIVVPPVVDTNTPPSFPSFPSLPSPGEQPPSSPADTDPPITLA